MDNTLFLVIPCYNEEQAINETARQLKIKMTGLISSGKISAQSKICFVNDGSEDTTWEIIRSLNHEDSIFRGINLSRNKGHQNALLAGLMTVKSECDAVISLDADLQDDIGAIDKMVDKWVDGCDIVYGVRSSRKTDTFFKKTTALAYYKLLKFMGVDITYNHADYRLMSRRAIDALENFKEVNLFLRGIVPMIGFKSDMVYYERNERIAGKSKYPLKKMISFALEGITSLSVKPIRMITVLGLIIFVISVIMLITFIVKHYSGQTIEGWTSTVVSIWGIGGLQLLAIGIIGEYIGKIYLETKHRPKYIIEEYLK